MEVSVKFEVFLKILENFQAAPMNFSNVLSLWYRHMSNFENALQQSLWGSLTIVWGNLKSLTGVKGTLLKEPFNQSGYTQEPF